MTDDEKTSPAFEFIKRACEETGRLAVNVVFPSDALIVQEINPSLGHICNDWMDEVSHSPPDSPHRECFICRDKLRTYQDPELGEAINPSAIFVLRHPAEDRNTDQNVVAGGLCAACATGTSREVAARIGAFISADPKSPVYTPEEYRNRRLH